MPHKCVWKTRILAILSVRTRQRKTCSFFTAMLSICGGAVKLHAQQQHASALTVTRVHVYLGLGVADVQRNRDYSLYVDSFFNQSET